MRGAQPTGTYTGAPAAFELRPCSSGPKREERRLVVVDVLKDMPGFGSTARARAAPARPRGPARPRSIAEVPGARLLHVVRGAAPTPCARRVDQRRCTAAPSVLASDLAGG